MRKDLQLLKSLLETDHYELVLEQFIEYLRFQQREYGTGLKDLSEAVELGVLTIELAHNIEPAVYNYKSEYKLTKSDFKKVQFNYRS